MTRAELCSCHGKKAFAAWALAKQAAARIRGRTTYRCDHCRRWYVGGADGRDRRAPYERVPWHWRSALADLGA
jgi:hypothetical protein